MKKVPLECGINIALNGPVWVEFANSENGNVDITL